MTYDLHASRAGGVHEALLDDATVQAAAAHEGLDGHERRRSVVRLVLAEQRDEHVLVDRGGRADRDHLAADPHLAIHDLEVAALDAGDRVNGARLLEEDVENFLLLSHDDDNLAGLDDAGLFARDLFDRGAQPLRVIQGDRRDDGDAGVDDVRSVPAPAHADLDDGGIDRVVGEGSVRHDREDLEEGQARATLLRAALVHHANVRLDVLPCAHEALARDRVTLQRDAFAHVEQVRAREAARLHTEGGEERVDHARRRRLAVRTRDVDRRVEVLRVAQDVQGELHTVERGVDVVLGCARDDGLVDLLHARVQGDVVLRLRERSLVGGTLIACLGGVVGEVLVHLALNLREDGGIGAQQQRVLDEGAQRGLAFALLSLGVDALPRLGVLDLVGRFQVRDQVGRDAAALVLVGGVFPEERFACHVSSAARSVSAILPGRVPRAACSAGHGALAQTDRMKAFTMIHFRRQHVGKWFGQASEIEELRAENSRLKEQVAHLEARLRAAYADAGVTALAGASSPAPEAAVPQASAPAFPADAPNPATASFPELNATELQMIAEGRVLNAVKAYRDRTGVDLKTAKAAIDVAR